MAYRSVDGSLPGLNLGLKPARSNNYEAGIKASGDHVRGGLAAFYIQTEDELSVLQNSGGRTVSQNVGETNRRGLELGVDADWHGFTGRLAYTYIRAVVGQDYATCIAAPATRSPIPAGWVANLRAGFVQETRHWRFSEFARLDNLANRA